MPSFDAIFRQFESLGTNCEFGLVMRHFGVERPSLLKWAGFQTDPETDGLLRGVKARFDGAGRDVDIFGTGISRDNKYCLVFHTGEERSGIEIALLWRNEMARIGWLARNFVDDAQEARRIYVFKRSKGVEEGWVRELHKALSEYGPVWLLWVEEAADPSVVGTVQMLGPRLMRGWIDRFAPEDEIHRDCSYEVWLRICQAALTMREAQRPRSIWDLPIDSATPTSLTPSPARGRPDQPGKLRQLLARLFPR